MSKSTAGHWGTAIESPEIVEMELPTGTFTRVTEALPPPEALAARGETIKITLMLSQSSVRFSKQKAAEHHTKYQRMIREVVDRYAAQYSDPIGGK